MSKAWCSVEGGSCMINGEFFSLGSQATVLTTEGRIMIKCEEMRVSNVVIKLTNGTRFELPSPRLKEVIHFTP